MEERLPHDKQQKEFTPPEYDWAEWAGDTRQGGIFGCYRKAQNTMGEISNSIVSTQRRWHQYETPVPGPLGCMAPRRQTNIIFKDGKGLRLMLLDLICGTYIILASTIRRHSYEEWTIATATSSTLRLPLTTRNSCFLPRRNHPA